MSMTLQEEIEGYQEQLQNSDEGLKFYSDRGITPDSIDKFKLGWVTEALSVEARRWGMGSAVIPYVTLTNKVITAKVRRKEGSKPKYGTLRHDFPFTTSKTHLFNAGVAMPTVNRSTVAIVEGELDAVIVEQCGVKAVGLPSATGFRDHWAWLFSASEPIIALDGDEAGQEGAGKIEATLLRRAAVDARIAPWPEGKDATDVYLDGGREAIREHLGVD